MNIVEKVQNIFKSTETVHGVEKCIFSSGFMFGVRWHGAARALRRLHQSRWLPFFPTFV